MLLDVMRLWLVAGRSEKPIAASRKEALELVQMAGKKRWFEPSFRVAAAALAAKSVGEVLAFTGSSLAYMPPDTPYMQPNAWRMSTGILADASGNWIVDVGVHYAAALRLTLGDVRVAPWQMAMSLAGERAEGEKRNATETVPPAMGELNKRSVRLPAVHAVHRRVRPELLPFDSFAATLRANDTIGVSATQVNAQGN
eukprot:Skav210093  [mRNA]  locus=scaffold1510:372577:377157:- [translate_table: standard]